MTEWIHEREAVLGAALEMTRKGLVIGKAGNVSCRVIASPGLVAITPTSKYYDSLAPSDICIVDLQGRLVGGSLPPSSEVRMHLAIYRSRPDAGAVVHTHSVYASAVSVGMTEIPAVLEEEVALLGGNVRVARFAPSGTAELADNAVAALVGRKAAVLANHGVVGIGGTVREALESCELVEKAAQVYLLALMSAGGGEIRLLGTDAGMQM